MSEEETTWREIIVDVEPRQKEFRVAVEEESTVDEVVKTLVQRCVDEGVDITKWAKEKVGQPNVSFVLMRKAFGNTALAPAATFGSLEPPLENNERFKLDACAQVG
ncbi:MAG: hypothetical protein ACTSXO_07650 [Candidatus Heimdallarchaeota archaeon]|nr:hypothetical protein [Candidatus Heimdallarchaeota archaeon]RLI72491.1 MAG: hypothetical protein DRP02_01430 [Candidatus Gerdarchaeota archaeon]RLI74266.1 MAG: hypothetical protein DRO91_00950 [Candidatus Heimdallarchaeota archaeon]